MSNVIQFRPKTFIGGNPNREPTFTITVYDNPGDAGFQWYCNSDEPIDYDRLQDYVGDMFMSMLPAEDLGIFQRIGAFFSNLFYPSKD